MITLSSFLPMIKRLRGSAVAFKPIYIFVYLQVDSWLRREESEGGERVEEVRRKLEEAYQANRSLHMNLSETTTNLGLMRSDLAQMRLQYEEKCRELHK